MTRRLALPPLALMATLSLVLGACSPTPSAPALTDPREIVTKGVTSLTDAKSFEFTGTFSGTAAVPQLGTFDLSSIRMAGAVDVSNKSAKFSFDAPTVLATRIEAIVVGGTAYYKVAGAPAMFLGGSADKYTAVAVPTASGDPAAALTDVTKLVTALQAGLAMLPSPLTKAADEKCGDADCYHVSTSLSSAQLQAFGASLGDGAVKVDIWTRKVDYRPTKFSVALTSTQVGSFGATIDVRYDVGLSVAAPPADQIAP